MPKGLLIHADGSLAVDGGDLLVAPDGTNPDDCACCQCQYCSTTPTSFDVNPGVISLACIHPFNDDNSGRWQRGSFTNRTLTKVSSCVWRHTGTVGDIEWEDHQLNGDNTPDANDCDCDNPTRREGRMVYELAKVDATTFRLRISAVMDDSEVVPEVDCDDGTETGNDASSNFEDCLFEGTLTVSSDVCDIIDQTIDNDYTSSDTDVDCPWAGGLIAGSGASANVTSN